MTDRRELLAGKTVRLLLPLVVLIISACDPVLSSAGDAERIGAGAADPPRVAVPEGAIEVRDGFYMVPLAEPVAGCPAYRAFWTLGPVAQAIYFRAADGRFVLDRNEAVCD